MGLTKSFIKEKTERKWYLVDLENQVLGRVASKIAMILRGKDKSSFTPHEDVGDFVIAINAKGIHLTGNKLRDKYYHHYTNHIGGIKDYTAEKLLKRKPGELLYRAVKGMLPKSTLGRHQLKKLKIYPGAEHPHQAQTPEVLNLKAKNQHLRG
jgi:large subunit ribosomal protein L13